MQIEQVVGMVEWGALKHAAIELSCLVCRVTSLALILLAATVNNLAVSSHSSPLSVVMPLRCTVCATVRGYLALNVQTY